ncbi:239_t:CDS:2 [Paraglomus brasilianum]|uniref:239_t:CDS:1 n=1 Tax=Paraglomus brasilianum TaxID=144538 RepID=A0A9N9FH25_9GLOM|nr:239_t:CDS:2 [Paraglomus brasilianum]
MADDRCFVVDYSSHTKLYLLAREEIYALNTAKKEDVNQFTLKLFVMMARADATMQSSNIDAPE